MEPAAEAPSFDRLPRDRRRTVAAAVRRGQVVRDPRDAYAAVEYARRLQAETARWMRPRGLLVHIVGALAAVSVALRDVHRWPDALLLLVGLWPLGLVVVARRLRGATAEAERLNAQLLAAHGLAAPPDARARGAAPDWRLVLAFALTPLHLGILAVALLVTGAAGSATHATHARLLVLALFAFGGVAVAGVQLALARASLRDPRRLRRAPRAGAALLAGGCAAFWIVETAIVLVRNW